MDFVKPYGGDPQVGHLSTPISDSGIVRAYINNLPAYRPGLSPLLRGLEVGMAHGYFLIGPMILLGPLRDYPGAANLGGLVVTLALLMILTICLAAYGIVSFQGDKAGQPGDLQSADGWSQFAGGFFLGGSGGALFAYFLIENIDTVNAMLSGLVN